MNNITQNEAINTVNLLGTSAVIFDFSESLAKVVRAVGYGKIMGRDILISNEDKIKIIEDISLLNNIDLCSEKSITYNINGPIC